MSENQPPCRPRKNVRPQIPNGHQPNTNSTEKDFVRLEVIKKISGVDENGKDRLN